MSLTLQEKVAKLRYVAQTFNCDTHVTMMLWFNDKDIVPGICTNKNCNLIANVERSEEGALCPNCNTHTVQSVFVLADVV